MIFLRSRRRKFQSSACYLSSTIFILPKSSLNAFLQCLFGQYLSAIIIWFKASFLGILGHSWAFSQTQKKTMHFGHADLMSITHKFVYRHMSSVRATWLPCACRCPSCWLIWLFPPHCPHFREHARSPLITAETAYLYTYICCPVPGIVLNFKIFTPQFCLLISGNAAIIATLVVVVVVVFRLFVISFNVVRQHFGDCFRLCGFFFLPPPLSVSCCFLLLFFHSFLTFLFALLVFPCGSKVWNFTVA